jgi:hypothetical protein
MHTQAPSGSGIVYSVRTYAGEYAGHDHAHAQIMFALDGRMELEIGGRAAFTDTSPPPPATPPRRPAPPTPPPPTPPPCCRCSCGMIIPAGVAHTFMSPRGVRMVVIDTPDDAGVDRIRRFAVTAACRNDVDPVKAAQHLAHVLEAPSILARRSIDLARLDTSLGRALHDPWDTARMAALFFLSPQRFHARLLELTGLSPQAYLRSHRLDAAQRLLRGAGPLHATAGGGGSGAPCAGGVARRRKRLLGARRLRAD